MSWDAEELWERRVGSVSGEGGKAWSAWRSAGAMERLRARGGALEVRTLANLRAAVAAVAWEAGTLVAVLDRLQASR